MRAQVRARTHHLIFNLDNRSTRGAPLPHVDFAPPCVSFHVIITCSVNYWSIASHSIPAGRVGLLFPPFGSISQHCVILIVQYHMQHTDMFNPHHPTAFRASISGSFGMWYICRGHWFVQSILRTLQVSFHFILFHIYHPCIYDFTFDLQNPDLIALTIPISYWTFWTKRTKFSCHARHLPILWLIGFALSHYSPCLTSSRSVSLTRSTSPILISLYSTYPQPYQLPLHSHTYSFCRKGYRSTHIFF
jgi:hypothetical protein